MKLDVLAPELAQIPEIPLSEPKRSSRAPAGRRAVVRVTERFHARPERVFDAWLAPAISGRWLFATASRPMSRVAIDARVGGAFRFVDAADGIEYTGVYFEIVRPRRLAFTLAMDGGRQAMSRVVADIVPLRSARSPAGSEVIVRHEGLPDEHASRMEARWTGMLYGLGTLLE